MSISREWLDEHGEGLHHVAVVLHDFDESTDLGSRHAIDLVPDHVYP